MLKGPVLQTFEKYGDTENIYHPLPSLLFWSGIMIVFISPIIAEALVTSTTNIAMPGFMMILAAYLVVTNPQYVREHPNIFFIYPRWYHELRARTSRYERRRIAYKWLWLPPRLRLIYSSSDRAFSQWADLIIMTTTDIDETPTDRIVSDY
ncbi:MAG: hypothetical protein K8L99_08860 [Anaerolineae bacterium]|nr:hypothetical protein [Anaerolineae bacterium]